MHDSADTDVARPGPPRRADVEAAINAAVREVLCEAGYAALTYELVATRAGTSRPALYRRAATKAQLVVNALVASYGLAPVPDTGSIETDLLELQRAQLRLYNDPVIGASLPGLLLDIRTNSEARDVWVGGFVRPRRDGVMAAVARAIHRGELVDDTDAQWVCDILTGPIISTAFLTGKTHLPDNLAAETVALVLCRFQTPLEAQP